MSNAFVESDPRFPSGKWVGFYLDRRMPGRHQMELTLNFADGQMSGDGQDRVGRFTVAGTYSTTDGKCNWVKQYLKAHALTYRGFNEGKGIWGTWELIWSGSVFTGGFHIWPDGTPDPTRPRLAEEADVPLGSPALEPELVPG
jgi:hypothetical protein